jgi:(p)ppGpp synthase/HD superfamily hydrolase
MSEQDSRMLAEAVTVASQAHLGMTRKGSGAPYITHPLRVMQAVLGRPDGTIEMATAAVLHDVLEDTSVTAEMLLDRFPAPVVAIVQELTNASMGSTLPRAARKAMDRESLAAASTEARIIKLHDRLDNLRELEGVAHKFQLLFASESVMLVEAIGSVDPMVSMEIMQEVRRIQCL